jgi:UDP-N-acetylmuramoyl-L-alanyl-D-glutamate--2,6-diaminopimelate ligase
VSVVTLDQLAAIPIEGGSAPTSIVPGTSGGGDVRITAVSHDSRHAGAGTLFACLRGESFDGHEFAGRAADAGAVALLVDHELPDQESRGLPQLVVPDTRAGLGPLAAAVAGHPSDTLTTVGITGTNGKTTTAAMVAAIFEANDWPAGVLGTLSGARTTPEAPELQDQLARFVREGRRAAVLEVSSHALALNRVDGTHFDAVVFTNLGRDHLDLHGSPEQYFRAKASLFSPTFSPLAVVNVDDSHGRLLADALAHSPSDPGRTPRVVEFCAADLGDVSVGSARHSYRWRGRHVDVPIGGAFNVANSHAALVTAVEVGVPPDVAVDGLRRLPPIPGRFEHVRTSTPPAFSVVVDYAHTPDGLGQLLDTARSAVDDSASVILVFGCGGERDHAKRAEMGAIATSGADRVVVTSDNPRREDPRRIIDEILGGAAEPRRARVTSEVDRRRAIEEAIGDAAPGDIVLIAGKGHEAEQDLGDRTIDFDDRAVAREILHAITRPDEGSRS